MRSLEDRIAGGEADRIAFKTEESGSPEYMVRRHLYCKQS